ncbi:MAG: GntR family transcriptional regulator [Lentisphaeria bacterium]|nr:GntR family transcriptional regulator [Lentisphaeria bacterium]
MSIRYAITEHFRKAIITGEYPGGCMLPSTQKIADDFNTKPANVQRALALLVKEGLIIREQGIGTRVCGKSDELRSIAIYLNRRHMEAMNHYRQYYWSQLCRRFKERNIDYRVVVEDENGNGFRVLENLAENGEIQAISYLELEPEEIKRLLRLPVAVAGLSSTPLGSHICLDCRTILKPLIPELAAHGCRSLAIISPLFTREFLTRQGPNSFGKSNLTRLEKMGIELNWKLLQERSIYELFPDKLAQFGYRMFHRLMELPERPDALLAYPDQILPGILAAAYERGIDLGGEFRLIAAHRNRELPELFPVKSLWLEVSLNELVAGSVELLFNVFHRTGPQDILIGHRLCHS